MRTALYARVSTDNGKQDTENQLQELRDFCHRSGWEITAEYVDHATGGNSNRPAFQRMFEDASKRKFDVVLFWALDRLSREGTLATLQHLERLTAYGINWKSYQESYLDSVGPFRDVVVSLMATLARQEKLRISERTCAGLRKARRAGRILGRPRVEVCARDIETLQGRGLSQRKVAAELGVSLATVVRTLQGSR
jgi:DNA invertase Pin-like site-specific DNA recombinase